MIRYRWGVTRVLSTAFTLLTFVSVAGMYLLFVMQSLPMWKHSGWGFLYGKEWFYRDHDFGAAPMIYGTLAVAMVALLLAVPLGIGAALFTSEFLTRRPRMVVKVIIELLAGIPSVIYGLLGILILRNWIYDVLHPFDPLSGDTLLTAGILLGIMILPTIMTLSDDALRAVPAAQRMAARGLGLNASEVVFRISLPQAAPGLVAAVLLGMGRALGETIAVFLVIGRQDNQWPNPLLSLKPLIESGQTLTSKLGGSEIHIAYGDRIHWGAMMGLALSLLVMVTLATLIGVWLQRKQSDELA